MTDTYTEDAIREVWIRFHKQDIVERLRAGNWISTELGDEAADEIERLRTEMEVLQKRLLQEEARLQSQLSECQKENECHILARKRDKARIKELEAERDEYKTLARDLWANTEKANHGANARAFLNHHPEHRAIIEKAREMKDE